jgi:phage terminase large subunit-like protein
MSALVPKQVEVRLKFTPFAHQAVAHDMRETFRFLVLVWHRRGGKTVFAVIELLLAALCCVRPNGRFAYIAPFLSQAKTVAWPYLRQFSSAIPGVLVNESECSVRLPNGAVVRLFGADNPDALRGNYFDGVVLDEVADMRPHVWAEIIRPALADRQGWACFIGTPKGTNLFSELYHRAARGEEGWGCGLLRAQDTGIIAPAEIEAARREMSASQFAQEFECDFAASVDDVLIRLEVVLAAEKRVYAEKDYSFAAKVLGVDVARYGDDATVLTPRQGLACFKQRTLRGLSTMDTAAHVAEAAAKWKPDAIMVDVGGVGAAVVDRLEQLGVSVMPVDFGSKAIDPRYENKRAEIWSEMATWLASGRVPVSVELQRDLTAPRYSYANARGRFQLESKDDMRKRGLPSPDHGDSLACTFAFPVVPGADSKKRVTSVTEYDPHAAQTEE